MALDIGKRHDGDGGDDDGFERQHRHLTEFVEGVEEVVVNLCDFNDMCVNCSMNILSVHALGKWLAHEVARHVITHELDGARTPEAREFAAKEIGGLIDQITRVFLTEVEDVITSMREAD